MRLISPPNLKTTIYDKNITGILFSKSGEYRLLGENIIREFVVPEGFYWVVNSVALRLGYINQVGRHPAASLKVCVDSCKMENHILGLSIYSGDGILEKNMSISPGLVLNENKQVFVTLYMERDDEPVYVSYYIAITGIEK